MRTFRAIAISILFLLFIAHITNAQTGAGKTAKLIDFNFLLKEMVNREDLAKYPREAWTLHHASSYDRRSIAKNKPGWFANKDWDNYIRKETRNGHNEYVLIDANGPGVITRFWVAGFPNQKAHLRFYIDGQSTPFWEADHTGALIGQNVVIGEPLSQRSVDRDSLTINPGAKPGHNLYAPIPFEYHIKVTYDRPPGGADHGFWYNIDYRIYKAAAKVKSFSTETPKNDSELLRQTNNTFKNFMAISAKETIIKGERSVKNVSFNLSPGASKSIVLEGTGSVRRLFLSVMSNPAKAVKSLWLQITFDGRQTVNVPVGFFFGCGDQLVEARNWYSKVDSSGIMAAFWVMPYHRSAVISLLNKGKARLSGELKVAIGSWKWAKSTMCFHADFKRMNNYMTVAKIGKDFNYINLKDKAGVYVGDILQVNKAVGGWWGEGDEKIYIDGSTFPNDFGTGTEDYYGYAWGHPETFNHIFNSQPLGNANLINVGGTTVDSRERDLDAIPFCNSFRFDMGSWNWFGGPVNYAWTCFWYEKRKQAIKKNQ
ncbi:MAG TPA: glycoside hydrolase family 172 protein [Hanamia sp.]|nr:glycoside hydrolase family 172 protein [Hanamia sp.]